MQYDSLQYHHEYTHSSSKFISPLYRTCEHCSHWVNFSPSLVGGISPISRFYIRISSVTGFCISAAEAVVHCTYHENQKWSEETLQLFIEFIETWSSCLLTSYGLYESKHWRHKHSIDSKKRTVRISGVAIGTVYKLNLLRTVFINTAKSLKLQILADLRTTALVRNDGNHKQFKFY